MIRTFFGSPGCGKTTLACKLARKYRKNYDYLYLNFKHNVPACGYADLEDLGLWTFPDRSYIAIDEAGIEYNSRAYKSLKRHTIAWFKKHRHYRCNVDVFSQSWEDMDITIRRLSDQLWYMYKLGPFTLCRRVYKRVTVDKTTQQIIDGYKMVSMLWVLLLPIYGLLRLFGILDRKFMFTFRPFYYRYFDSWDKDPLPVRNFQPDGTYLEYPPFNEEKENDPVNEAIES